MEEENGKTSLTRGHILAEKMPHCQKHSETTLPRCQGIEMAKGLKKNILEVAGLWRMN